MMTAQSAFALSMQTMLLNFVPVQIVAQEKNGFWITGPKNGDRIITLGQEYVVAGEKVETAPDERIADKTGRPSEDQYKNQTDKN